MACSWHAGGVSGGPCRVRGQWSGRCHAGGALLEPTNFVTKRQLYLVVFWESFENRTSWRCGTSWIPTHRQQTVHFSIGTRIWVTHGTSWPWGRDLEHRTSATNINKSYISVLGTSWGLEHRTSWRQTHRQQIVPFNPSPRGATWSAGLQK